MGIVDYFITQAVNRAENSANRQVEAEKAKAASKADAARNKISKPAGKVVSSANSVYGAVTGYKVSTQEQFGAVGDAVLNSAEAVLRKRLEDFINSLFELKPVKIKSLLNTFGGFASQNINELPRFIGNSITNWVTDLNSPNGALKQLARLADEIGADILNDPSIKDSIASLNEVKTIADAINGVTDIYNNVMDLINQFEPYFPIIEIIVSICSIWINPPAGVKSASEIGQMVMNELKKLPPLIIKPIRDYIFEMEIPFPAALLGLLDATTMPGAADEFKKNLANSYIVGGVNESVASTMKSLKYPTYKKQVTGFLTTNNPISAFVSGTLRESESARSIYGTVLYYTPAQSVNGAPLRFSPVPQTGAGSRGWTAGSTDQQLLSDVDTSGVVNGNSGSGAGGNWAGAGSNSSIGQGDQAGTTRTGTTDGSIRTIYSSKTVTAADGVGAISSGGSDLFSPPSDWTSAPNTFVRKSNAYVSLSENDIRLAAAKLLKAKDTSEGFYVDRQLQKLIVEALMEDGISADPTPGIYNELETAMNPSGPRGLFKVFNDRIKIYHDVLKVVFGEDRANISETIPVVDFYRKENTHFLKRYIQNGKFNQIEDCTQGIKPTSPLATTKFGDNLMEATDPNAKSMINYVMAYYPIAEHFYGTTDRRSARTKLCTQSYVNTNSSNTYTSGGKTYNTAEMSGLLVGKYCTVKTRGTNGEPTEWGFENHKADAPGFSDNIAVGSRYYPNHFYNRGTPVQKPLTTATPGYVGLASEWWAAAQTFISSMVTTYSVAPATWNNLQSITITNAVSKLDAIEPLTQVAGKQITEKASQVLYTSDSNEPTHALTYGTKLSTLTDLSGAFAAWAAHSASTLTITIGDTDSRVSHAYIGVDLLTEPSGAPIPGHTGTRPSVAEKIAGAKEGQSTAGLIELYSNGSVYYAAYVATDSANNKVVLRVDIIGPRGLLTETGKESETGTNIIYSTSTDLNNSLGNLYLVSDTAYTTNDAVFLYNAERFAAFRITAVQYFNPSITKITVNGGSLGNFVWDASTAVYAPDIRIIGGACYIYKIESIISNPTYSAVYYPMTYPNSFLHDGNVTPHFKEIVGMRMVPRLPTLSGGATYDQYKKSGMSLAVFNNILSGDILAAYIRLRVQNTVIIDAQTGPDVLMSQLPSFIEPIVLQKNLLLGFVSDDVSRENLNQYANYWRLILDALIPFTSNAMTSLTQQHCLQLDALMGNNGSAWITIGTGDNDVSRATWAEIRFKILQELDGDPLEGSYPVQRLLTEDAISGRRSSLYYKRFQQLAIRMDRMTGALARAELLLFNWDILRNANGVGRSETIDSYRDYVRVTKVYKFEEMTYAPSTTRGRGKFYFQSVIDKVRNSLSDKCLLVCAPCPVKQTCPFYDEAELLKANIPETSSLSFYLKDNELDLLVYEAGDRLNLYSTDGNNSRIDAQRVKNRHKIYASIVRDPKTDIDLEDAKASIKKRLPLYSDAIDNLAWLEGGRYGSLKLKVEKGAVVDDLNRHSYLYDALFIKDEESEFEYAPSNKAYPVSLTDENNITYEGSVRIKKPIGLKMMLGRDVLPTDELYLICDDVDGETGEKIPPIFLNTLDKIQIGFDIMENDQSIMSASDTYRFAGSQDIAQWSVNYYKTLSSDKDQFWMPIIQKEVPSTRDPSRVEILSLPGRPRAADVVDPIITESPSVNDIIRGKPFVRSFINYIRKVYIRIQDANGNELLAWTKATDYETIEKRRRQIQYVKTNVQLVLVKR